MGKQNCADNESNCKFKARICIAELPFCCLSVNNYGFLIEQAFGRKADYCLKRSLKRIV